MSQATVLDDLTRTHYLEFCVGCGCGYDRRLSTRAFCIFKKLLENFGDKTFWVRPVHIDARNRLSSVTHQHIQNVLLKAKSGDQDSIGELLSVYRDYLLGIAVARLDPRIRARCNPSDVVQETLLEAFRDFHQFRGGLEREFLAWIRQILANNLARMVEVHLLTDKRDLRRERRIEPLPNASSSRLENRDHWFTDNGASPSSALQKKEQLSAVLERISRLPSNYRDVLILRHIEDLSFDEVASRLGKSAGAVRMIWLRALEQLRDLR